MVLIRMDVLESNQPVSKKNGVQKIKIQNPKITKYIRVRFFDQKRRKKKKKKKKQTNNQSFIFRKTHLDTRTNHF